MEQEIRFCELDGRRIAYATVGRGAAAPLRRPVGHTPRGGVGRPARAELLRGARPDASGRPLRPARRRPLRSRRSAKPPTLESETRMLAAVLEACGDEPATLFACSCAGLATARFASAVPERVAEGRLLRRLRRAQRHPRGDSPLARRLRPHELAARRADARRPARPARKRRRDRRAQPLPAARGRGGRRGRVPRARPDLRRAASSCRR